MVYEVDDDFIEIELTNEKIDELVSKLKELKLSKKHIHFSLDSEHEILIHHIEDELK